MSFSMTPMPTQRENHSCGLVTNPDQGAEIVTAGGYYNDRLYSVDIYTINTDSWRAGNLENYSAGQLNVFKGCKKSPF